MFLYRRYSDTRPVHTSATAYGGLLGSLLRYLNLLGKASGDRTAVVYPGASVCSESELTSSHWLERRVPSPGSSIAIGFVHMD